MTERTLSEVKAHILARAVEDESFRTSLLADPKPVISAELGISIPDEFDIHVHEENVTSAHLVLPLSDNLSEQELEKIAAGVDVNWDTVNIS